MIGIDENEVAWIAQNRAMARFVALASALLFASYAGVDWLMDPALLAQTWPWRLAGAVPCLVAAHLLRGTLPNKWAPLYIAISGVVAIVVVSVIFLGILGDIKIAIVAQMQVLMAAVVFATLRSAVRLMLPALLVSFNAGMWWKNTDWPTVVLTNWLLLGAIVIVLVVSETAYRTFLDKRRLEAERQQQATIVQTSEDAIIGRNLDGQVTSWNAGAQRLFGYTAAHMLGQTLQVLVPPDRSAEEQVILDRIAAGETVNHFETSRLCKDGSVKEVSVSMSALRDRGGRISGSSQIARDISERRRVEQALRDKDALFRTAIETTSDGFWAVDSAGKLVDANQAYARQSGYTRAELLTLHISDLEAKEAPLDTAARMEKIMRDGSATFEIVHRRKDASVWPVEVITTYASVHGGQFFVFTKDLTDRKRTEELTWHQANFDSLTDLPNRALLFDRLAQECSVARRNNSGVALLFADLDGFKLVNDNFGHDAGDLVLKEVAQRWLACVREVDTVARLGGDEFAIVLGGLQDPKAIAGMADKLIAALAPAFQLPNGASCRVGVSIGICLYPADATEVDTMISIADLAMYASKARGKNTFTFSQTRLDPFG
jgi:diguanylate cyclase (GGDEF)-like protein/PAS domain S-box-containing protein